MKLCAEGRLDPLPLVSHLLPALEAANAYALIDEPPPDLLQVILDFRGDFAVTARRRTHEARGEAVGAGAVPARSDHDREVGPCPEARLRRHRVARSGEGQFAARLPELSAAAAAGVPMPTVCVEMLHFVGDFDSERRRDALAQMRSQLSVMAAIGGRLAMTPASYGMFSRRLPPFECPRTEAEDQEILLDAFGQLAEHAEAEGVVIALEPLNRYENHMINTLDQARLSAR